MTLYTDSFPPNNIIMLAPDKRTRGGFMHRCGTGFLLTLVITFVIALTGCLGKSSHNPNGGAVKTVTLSPSSNFSIDVGGTQIFSANATDANGRPVLGVSIQFIVASGNPNASAPPFAVPELPGSPSSPRSSRGSAARPRPSTFTSTSTAFRSHKPSPNRPRTTVFPRTRPGNSRESPSATTWTSPTPSGP